MLWKYAVCVALGYLLGSFNGALVISRFAIHEDVRTKGSGNAGLTNFHRSYGGWITLLVIVIDLGKMVGAALLAPLFLPEQARFAGMLAGFSVQLGHIFPLYFGFRGGKGILSSAALALVMDWRIFVITLSVFILVFALTKYVSLGSVLASAAYAICFGLFFASQPEIWILALLMALMAIFMHRGNIRRLLQGQERKTYLKKSKNK